MLSPYLECARVTTTHGVRGAVRLENRCDSPAVLASLKTMYLRQPDGTMRPLTVAHASVQKQMVLASFDEIPTMEDAIRLRGAVLYAARQDLPLAPGAHFIADLIGLPVVDAARGPLGTLDEVLNPAGQSVYSVRRPNGETFLFPAVPAFVEAVSLGEADDGRPAGIYVTLIDGFLPEEKDDAD